MTSPRTTALPRRAALGALAGAAALGAAGCSAFGDEGRSQYERAQGHSDATASTGPAGGPSPEPSELPYDVRPLLAPAKKYFGVALDGAPASVAPLRRFAKQAGKKPDLVEFYSAWGDAYETRLAVNAWEYGALPYIAWEPFKKTLAQIGAGKDDAYVRGFARDVRDLNQPVAISFAHEMNGHWYPWGSKKATPAAFVRAWRHLHDVFADEGATQVIWVWSPNVINPVPDVRLRPYWPGDAYVDWVGVIGYYGADGPATFRTLYGPTMDEVRAFTKKPFLIAETASEDTPRKPADIQDLFTGVKERDDVLGHVWFDFDKEADWRIASDPASEAAYRREAAAPSYGFDVRAAGGKGAAAGGGAGR
ncbi:glycoside hydrolase family 26 protein [Streptomyces sp. NRRL F-5630]|uniref:glycoside hydrolase family 26 protein n=1 Tax=Streptomyces sp. NRRL F-5630 TaxID=1463864 RepID=UPI003D731A65